MIEVRLPPIGEGIAEGEIVKWIVQKGQKIEAEQPLLEVLTDKAAVEIPAPQSGVVAELLFQEGDLVPVGSVVARLIQDEEVARPTSAAPAAAPNDAATSATPPDAAMATPAVRQKAREKGGGTQSSQRNRSFWANSDGRSESPCCWLACCGSGLCCPARSVCNA